MKLDELRTTNEDIVKHPVLIPIQNLKSSLEHMRMNWDEIYGSEVDIDQKKKAPIVKLKEEYDKSLSEFPYIPELPSTILVGEILKMKDKIILLRTREIDAFRLAAEQLLDFIKDNTDLLKGYLEEAETKKRGRPKKVAEVEQEEFIREEEEESEGEEDDGLDL